MKYKIGTKVKINKEGKLGWSALSCIEYYPDKVFIIESYGCKATYDYYTIVTKPRYVGATYRYQVTESQILSLQEIRDNKIEKVLQ